MIPSFIGQPDLRLGAQLLTMAVMVTRRTKTKNILFIIILLKDKKLIIAKVSYINIIYQR